MGSPWKAISDDNRRQILILLGKEGEKTPSEIATNFDFTLPALSSHLKVLKDAGLLNERKAGQYRYYSVDKEGMIGMAGFFDVFWNDRLHSLKEYVENKGKTARKHENNRRKR
jgi:DNA-binding transcriptional ArsR family regulator